MKNEGKSAVSERFIRTLENKSYKHISSILKKVDINKLDDVVNKYINTYHSTIIAQMKPANVKLNTYIDSNKENKKEDPKFKVGDHIRILKHKNIFAKGYIPNLSKEVFVIKKVKNTVPWTYIKEDIDREEIFRTFYEKELQKTNQS